MFHVEHSALKKSEKKLDFPRFLARGRLCESEVFFTNVTQLCVTAKPAKGVVFYNKIGAGAPVVSQRLYSGGLHLHSRKFAEKGVVCFSENRRGGASSRVTKRNMVGPAPIIQCQNELVKSYFQVWCI